MSVINLLPGHVADLIAAGEVVERPASVVKELLENAFDAGANNITVEIRGGGRSLIRVTDDGCGMSPEDAGIAFLRHATSKLRDAAGLEAISTMGFRGEALAAISAVSRIELITRERGAETGVRVLLQAGEIEEMGPAGCPEGTRMTVRELFFNTPARQKFLKSDRAEGGACLSAALRCALGRPERAVRFLRDGQEQFFSPGDGAAKSAVYSLLGRDAALGLLECRGEVDGITVEGFVSAPHAGRGNRSMQYFYLGGRAFRSPLLQSALEQAYQNTLLHGKYPACVLYLTMDLHRVDVNVHPAKLEVRFREEKKAFDAVYCTVRAALEEKTARNTATLKLGGGGRRSAEPRPDFFRFMSAAEFRERGLDGKTAAAGAAEPVQAGAAQAGAAPPGAGGKDSVAGPARPAFPGDGDAGGPARRVSSGDGSAGGPIPPAFSGAGAVPEQLGMALPRRESPPAALLRQEVEPLPVGRMVPRPVIPRLSGGPGNVPVGQAAGPDAEAPARFCGETEENGAQERDTPEGCAQKMPAQDRSRTGGPAEDAEAPGPGNGGAELPAYRVIGEALNAYILVETEGALLLIDKHACHERILFDALQAGLGRQMRQGLLVPLTWSPGAETAEMLERSAALLEEAGFDLERFGEDGVIVRAVPMDLQGDALEALEEIADTLKTGRIRDMREEILHTVACKAAIKAGTRSEPQELEILAARVVSGEIRYCPHGRPVAVKLTRAELDRQFKRIV